LQKKEFAFKSQLLEPKLKSTGNVPSEQTIYGYLNGKRELKIELIPYIAEVLSVTEQELFSTDLEYATEYNVRYSKNAREILDLLPYAPRSMVEHIKESLQKFKTTHEESVKKYNTLTIYQPTQFLHLKDKQPFLLFFFL